jgi:addiction module HigA family antidote
MEDNSVKGSMKNPPHPGQILKGLYLEPLELSITEAAEGLGVSRKTLSELINGHYGITPDMALRLSEAFNTTPKLWLNFRQNYDLRQAQKKEKSYIIRHFWLVESRAQPVEWPLGFLQLSGKDKSLHSGGCKNAVGEALIFIASSSFSDKEPMHRASIFAN